MNLKLIAVFVGPLLIIVALGVGTFQLWQSQYTEQLHSEQTELVNRGSVLMSRELGHMQQTVAYIGRVLEGYITPDKFESERIWRDRVAQYFVRAHALSQYIAQLRWIGPTGQELVRVNTRNHTADIVPQTGLQDKANRYYFIQGMAFDRHKVLLTPIDLNVEQGAIVRPYEITVRASYKLHSVAGEALGLLVVNYNLNYLFERLRTFQSDTSTLGILNAKGQWLLSERPELEWLHLYGDILSSFTNTYPSDWRALEQSQTLVSRRLSDGRPYASLPSYFDEHRTVHPSLFFLSVAREAVWQNRKTQMIFVAALSGIVGYSLLVTIGMLFWRLDTQRRQHLLLTESEKLRLQEAHEQLKQSNQKLIALQGELVEKSKLTSLGLMVSGVGHELSTPLGGIRLSLTSLAHFMKQMAPQVSAEHMDMCRQTIDLALRNVDHAADVVAQFKRITSNQIHQEPETFAVRAMLEDTMAPLASILKKHAHIDIRLEADPLLVVTSAQGVLSQAIQNLVLNALEHAFEEQQPGTITVVAKQEEDFVIEVSDNGQGIREDILEHIWEPFVTTGRSKQHTGLGLYLVHQWVTQLLNGHIEAANYKEGARFTITLPSHVPAKLA